MASSDDEDEVIPHLVANYYFEDEDNAPISFSVLPMWFVGKEKPNGPEKRVFLRGAGDGNQVIYVEVIAYRLGLEDAIPDIMVLTKDRNKWIKLSRPRKVYETTFRSILITIHLLHYLRKNPESSEKSLWDHMRKVFSSFEQFPSVNDLLDHYPLIKLLVESDNELAKCQLLLSLLEDKPRMKIFLEDHRNVLESKKSFIVDDLEDDMGNDIGDDSDNEIDLFDSVCAICDNGGEILCCEGRCMRSFHATEEDGEDSDCISLGYSKAQVKAIQHFVCKNCEYKRHQCYICGKLGSSDKSTRPEVFSCANATCGHFYHPKCVSNRLFPDDPKQAADCENKIASKESFTCPAHKCHVCKQGENKEIKALQFAVCRRCPRSYHRKCLPRKIAFEDDEEFTTRAWDDLLPSRILIYCLRHAIDEDLGTPIRNHIVFPGMEMKNKSKDLVKKTKPISNDLYKRSTYQMVSKQKESFSDSKEKKIPAVKCSESTIAMQALNFIKQQKSTKIKADSKSDIFDALESQKFSKGKTIDNAASESGGKVIISSHPKIDAEGVKRINDLMESTSSSITLADIIKKRKMPSTHRGNSRNLDKIITWGKLEGSVEAVKTALKKLDDGGSVEDAKAVCEPNVISLMMNWHSKLKTYLAPFIHGMRYTSFGRHFTKVDKLSEIVDKLQWYVQNDDMIVDFCCGANDFSRLMKEKLDSVGKKCSYKNYDIIQPKFDFNFEKRDWMTVHPKELPSGSRLIMGLNPPFGVRGFLANQFINKALSFKPKLVILIVPSETERLDKKQSPYDLIWEDSENLAGKSFYLPGSVDVNDMQMEQWNNKPPPLYLWSHPDWTTKHKEIAYKQGHIHDSKDKLTYGNKPQPKNTDENSDRTLKKIEVGGTATQGNGPKVSAESSMRSHPFKPQNVETKTEDDSSKPGEESKKRSSSAEIRRPDVVTKKTENKTTAAAPDKSKFSSESKKRSRSPDHHNPDRERKKITLKDKSSRFGSESKISPENRTAHGISGSETQKAKREKMESSSRKYRSESANDMKEGKVSDMSISPDEPRDDFVTPRAREPFDSRNTFDRVSARPNSQNPFIEEDVHARQYASSRISSASGINDIGREYPIQTPEERFYSGYRGGNYNYGTSVGDYGRRMGDAHFSAPRMGASVTDKYAPRLDEMNVPRSGGNYGLPGGTMHGLMRGNVDPFPYGSAPPAHGERPALYGGPSGAGELGPSSYGFASSGAGELKPSSYGFAPSGAGELKPSSYGFAPSGAGELKPSSYGFAPPGAGELGPSSYGFATPGAGAGNADPNSYYAPTAQHGFQRHNPGGSGGWFD